MFDLTSTKLLILGVVALIVVGPKDLPALLRTVGRYVGMMRRQANEFRLQLEEAMRESELADLKKEVETLGQETRSSLDDATRSMETQLGDIDRSVAEIGRADVPPATDVRDAAEGVHVATAGHIEDAGSAAGPGTDAPAADTVDASVPAEPELVPETASGESRTTVADADTAPKVPAPGQGA